MELLAEQFVAITFVLMGLSHVLAPRRWSEFFVALFASGAGPLGVAIVTLPPAALLVLTHNRWSPDLGLVATMYGWAALLKSAFYLLLPGVAERLVRARGAQPKHFVFAGALLVVLGLLVAWPAFVAPRG